MLVFKMKNEMIVDGFYVCLVVYEDVELIIGLFV